MTTEEGRKRCLVRSGVRELQDVLDRCVVDDETGCWLWRGAVNHETRMPVTSVPAGVLGAGQLTLPAGRAAWLVSGRRLVAGQVVYRACCNWLCVNPAPGHGATGTYAEMRAHYAQRGVHRGDPVRQARLRFNAAKRWLPAEQVRAAEDLLAKGMAVTNVARELGVSKGAVGRIARGQHPRQQVTPVNGASVFSWRP